MSFINYATKEINIKIVYYGPGLGGKTTNLQYIYSKTSPDSKGKMISLATETDRTLFFDFLPLDLGSIRGFTTRFHLYTVPGQVFYDASRKLVLKGVDGVIFVADSQKERMEANIESIRNLETNLEQHGLDLATLPYVLQLNKRDLANALPVEELYRILNYKREPTFEAVAPSGRGVFDALKSVAQRILLDLRKGRESSQSTLGVSEETEPEEQNAAPEYEKENKTDVESGLPGKSLSAVRVFISYSGKKAKLREKVLKLANRLRQNGVDARLDQYEACPREGWPRWATNEISAADFVLVVCTPGYSKRFHRSEISDEGKGVAWEANMILQEIYEAGGVNQKFLPVVFSSKHRSIVPVELRSSTIYELGRKDGYLELYRRITKQPEVEKPTLGKLPATPARQ